MSIKSRIEKIEHTFPKPNKVETKINKVDIAPLYGALPSEKEIEIANNKGKESNPGASELLLCFIPNGFEHLLQKNQEQNKFVDKDAELEYDHELGFVKFGNGIYKLVKKYDKGESKEFI